MYGRGSHHPLPLVIVLLFSLIPSNRSLTFDLTTSGIQTGDCARGRNFICLRGNASSLAGMIDLTQNQPYDLGWVYYSEPLHLWDSSTEDVLASFTTRFSLDIRLPDNNTGLGSGLTFFLRPYPYQTPPNSAAKNLGLVSDGKENTTSGLVAVEFDTYRSLSFSDPVNPHVGIDVNSLTSIKTVELRAANNVSIAGDVTVSYDSSSQNLSVVFLDDAPANPSQAAVSLSYVVDLGKVLPQWVVMGFSAATGKAGYVELNRIKSWEFNSTVIEVLGADQNTSSPVASLINEKQQSKVWLIVGVATGVAIVAVVVSLLLFVLWGRRNRRATTTDNGEQQQPIQNPAYSDHSRRRLSIDDQIEHDNGPRRFPYSDLAAATASFSESRKLGVGGFGSVYRGFLSDLNVDVAIKRFSQESKQGPKEYISEIKIISQLRHKNLVRLIGWCHDRADLLLVYVFMPNGSLDYHLFGEKSAAMLLPWPARYKIASGLASAVLYLHTEWEQCVVHRDIKTSNIMLDSNFNAKLGDFGLARVVDHEQSRAHTTNVAGTLGYLAPECITSRRFGMESDVYSFGIVLLEIASGRRAFGCSGVEGGNRKQLVDWVWDRCRNGRAVQVADRRLEGEFDESQMERLIAIGLSCANPDYKSRPSMKQVVVKLNIDVAPMPGIPKERAASPIMKNWLLHMLPTSGSGSSTAQPSSWGNSYGSIMSSTTTF